MSAHNDVRTFRGDELNACETLFPPGIDGDPWVHYHATSSINEERINAEGLRWSPDACSAAEVQELVRVFRSMNWCGIHTGGYVALDAFSLCGDFQGNEAKPIYFREFSLRSLIYAQRDFAGGESSRAVRYAMRDLDKYLAEESVRHEHYDYQRREAVNLASSGAVPHPVIRVDLGWLQQQIERLEALRKRCDSFEQAHQYGVAYAVRFTPDDIPVLNYSSSMGLRCYRAIPCEQIVGKVRVLADDGPLRAGNDSDLVWTNHWRHEDPNGLLAVLAEAEGCGRSYPSATPEMIFRHRSKHLIDPAAGVDDSEEIARAFGSSELAEYVRQHRQR
jgi:hypothetical protein